MADTEQPMVHFVKARAGREQHFLNGIPARDLTLDEWDALTDEQQENALTLGLYRLPEPKPAAAKAGASEGAAKDAAPAGGAAASDKSK